jgi:hypothetical protein
MNFDDFLQSLNESEAINEAGIVLKRRYTDAHPAKTASKTAVIRNKVIEAIKDGKLTKEEFNLILTKVSEDQKRWLKRNSSLFNVSEDGVTLSKAGLKIYNELTKENKIQNKPRFEMKRLVESFSEFVENLNNDHINEAFASSKLASLLTGGAKMPKDLPGAFYNMSQLALDKIQDVDIIEMDPETAKKEKRANAVYFYFTTNEKENPYTQQDWGTRTIPANTLLAITNGQNEWMNAEWSSRYGRSSSKTLKVTKRDDSAGISKSSANSSYGSKISSLKQVVELADRAYCLDLDILRARYSTRALKDERYAAKKGAVAFQTDKDFKAENLKRYNEILATKAAALPLDSLVANAIDTIAGQIKDGLSKGLKGRYDELIVGLDPKGREVKMNDAANLMRNILDEYSRYCGDAVQQEREKAAGYGESYYDRSMKQHAKNLQDYMKKIENMNYAW